MTAEARLLAAAAGSLDSGKMHEEGWLHVGDGASRGLTSRGMCGEGGPQSLMRCSVYWGTVPPY